MSEFQIVIRGDCFYEPKLAGKARIGLHSLIHYLATPPPEDNLRFSHWMTTLLFISDSLAHKRIVCFNAPPTTSKETANESHGYN
ncbi:hypothetical protein CDAR_28221 [Caerostris darwini]|uniref:Uncharacterized protein n=1 Tax=Caerostris darwini TaxID=1538125 RepID=A0AAV4NZH1_9ARAC|nr:hypothetical protein CDAR_28221 [Caerostris darwini]